MKKAISLFVALLVLLITVPAWSAGDVQIRDRNSNDKADVAQQNTDNVAATIYGLVVGSYLHGYDGTTWDRLTVGANDSDDVPSTTQGLDVRSFGYMWDTVNDDWDRMTGFEIKLSAKDMFALLVYNANLFMVGDTWQEWIGAPMDADNVSENTDAPWVGSFLYGHDGTAWDRLTTTESGDALSATIPGLTTVSMNHFYDGTNFRRWQGITMADNLTYPTAPFVGAVLLGDDGGTLDMVKLGAVGEVEMTDVATRPGEDAGAGLRHISKKDIAVYTPAKTTTAAIGTAPVLVLASTEVMTLPNWCIYLQNDDGADPFVDADVQVSPDGTSAWAPLTWTACDSLAATETCVYCVTGSGYRYVRVYVNAADANDVDVDAWLTANKG